MKGANTTEVDEKTEFPVIDILTTQKEIMEKSDYGGTMRLGAYAAILKENTKILKLYEETGRLKEDMEKIENLKRDKEQMFRLGILEKSKHVILERHRHRYEVNPKFVE